MAIEIRTLTDSLQEAQMIARTLVESGLCACAHIDQVESYYTWQGKMEHCPEYRVMLLTQVDLFSEVSEIIAQMHSYQEPGIYAFKVDKAPDSYLDWIRDNSKSAR